MRAVDDLGFGRDCVGLAVRVVRPDAPAGPDLGDIAEGRQAGGNIVLQG